MTNQELFDQVLYEATKLREHATEEERSRLDISKLRSLTVTNCIYGLMTGTCASERSRLLMRACTTHTVQRKYHSLPGSALLKCETVLLTYDEQTWMLLRDMDEPHERVYSFLSPIEFYIQECGRHDKESLIDFIQGKITVEEYKQVLYATV